MMYINSVLRLKMLYRVLTVKPYIQYERKEKTFTNCHLPVLAGPYPPASLGQVDVMTLAFSRFRGLLKVPLSLQFWVLPEARG